MPETITYSEALRFSEYCNMTEQFLQEYGSALRWGNCMIDAMELYDFIDRIVGS